MQGIAQLVAFVETAKHGGFAAAAREQGVTPSTLAKAVSRLESALGVKLFHRTTRQVSLTPDGERLFERCQRVLAELEDLEADASGTRAGATGTLRIELPVFYGKRFVLPLLARLQRAHPSLRLDVRLSDQQVDLVREGVDLAVRIGALRDSTLVARRIDAQDLLLCASPAYLEQHGTPRRLDDLKRHAAIVFRLPTTGRDRPWQLRHRGAPLALTPVPSVRISDTEALIEALRLGLGICQVPDLLVADDLQRGALVELFSRCRPEPMPIHAVYPSGKLVPTRVRLALTALESLRTRRSAKS